MANIISLFNGMNCGRLACEDANIIVHNYFASEIDVYANKVTRMRHPDTIFVGDVKELHYLNTGLCTQRKSGSWLDIPNSNCQILMGGSPCQDLRPGRDGLHGKKSKLFYEYLRILNQIKKYNPNVEFIFENVCRISNDDKNIISELLGVQPLRINSNLVSAQNRERYYWTNISVPQMPIDMCVNISDILEDNVDEKYYLSDKAIAYINVDDRIKKKYTAINGEKALTLQHNYSASCNGTFLCVDCNGRIDEFKANTLTQRYSKGVETFGGNPFLYDGNRFRKFTPTECEALQTIPKGYTEGVSDSRRYNMLGNGWTMKIISHILKYSYYVKPASLILEDCEITLENDGYLKIDYPNLDRGEFYYSPDELQKIKNYINN